MMKKNTLSNSLLCFLLLIICSCSKKNNTQPAALNTVTIEGTTYPTVTIGGQVWTTANFTGNSPQGLFLNTPDLALTGYYYSSVNINLPSGWRVPTRQDFDNLMSNFPYHVPGQDYALHITDALNLLSTSGWIGVTGTNKSGFNAYPAGILDLSTGGMSSVNFKGDDAIFLSSSSTTDANGDAELYTLIIDNIDGAFVSTFLPQPSPNTFSLVSLRFVRDK